MDILTKIVTSQCAGFLVFGKSMMLFFFLKESHSIQLEYRLSYYILLPIFNDIIMIGSSTRVITSEYVYQYSVHFVRKPGCDILFYYMDVYMFRIIMYHIMRHAYCCTIRNSVAKTVSAKSANQFSMAD